MISVSTAIANAIEQDNRTFDAKIYYNGAEIECDIQSLLIYKGACGDFSVGSVYAPYFEMTCNGDVDVSDKELLLKIGVKFNDTFLPVADHYFDIGYFTAHGNDIEKSGKQTTFTAVGKLSNISNVPYVDELPRTLATVKGKIETLTGLTITLKGITLDSTEITESMNGMTCRDALSVLASVVGGFVTEDNAGNVVIAKFGYGEAVRISTDRMFDEPKFADSYTLNTFKIIVNGAYTNSDGEEIPAVTIPSEPVTNPSYTASNKYMTESLYSKFYNNLNGLSFAPATVDVALGDPRLEPWDKITFMGYGGIYPSNTLYPSSTLYPSELSPINTMPCLTLRWKFDGGISMTVSANVESQKEQTAKGKLESRLESVEKDLTGTEQKVSRLQTHLYIAYSNNADGSGFNYMDIDRQYRGVYATVNPNAPTLADDPALFNWDVNPTWASKVANDYLYAIAGGVRLFPTVQNDGSLYMGLTATQLQFVVANAIRATLGYDSTFRSYGLIGETLMVKGSGASVRFDNGQTNSNKGQFIWEVRNGGHLTLKKGLSNE